MSNAATKRWKKPNLWRPPPKLGIAEWAEGKRGDDGKVISLPHLNLPRQVTGVSPGPMSLDISPYMRGILEKLQSPRTRRVTICTSTQLCKTTTLLTIALFAMFEDRNNFIYVVDSKGRAKKQKDERFSAIVESSPTLAAHIPKDAGSRRHAFAGAEVNLAGVVGNFVGANVSGDLASHPCKWLIGDELDEWKRKAGTVSPLLLARERQKSFHDAKEVIASTPKDHSPFIYDEFLNGTRNYYQVQCPLCGKYQALVFGNGKPGTPGLKYEHGYKPEDYRENHRSGSAEMAWYECVQCKGKILEDRKFAMTNSGVWVPETCEVDEEGNIVGDLRLSADHESFHLWSVYSGLPGTTWGHIVAAFLEMKSTDVGRRNFRNSWLGLPYRESAGHLAQHELERCKSSYRKRTYFPGWNDEEEYSSQTIRAPEGVEVVTMGIDVQGQGRHQYHYWSVWGWGKKGGEPGHSWLLRYGKTEPGPYSWDELRRIVHTDKYQLHDGNPAPRLKPYIDVGYQQELCATWADRNQCTPYKGRGNQGTKNWEWIRVKKNEVGEKTKCLMAFPPYFYEQIHRLTRNGYRHLPGDVGADYIAHQTVWQPHLEVVARTNDREIRWKKVDEYAPDHWWDTDVLAFIPAFLRGYTRVAHFGKPVAKEAK